MPSSASAADETLPPALPVSDGEFALAMAAFGGFESRPRLAIGVSGGADSLALVHLADRWARDRGGQVIGLTVDHRLRSDSGAEAVRVAEWLAAAGVEHRILAWDGPIPLHGLPAAARKLRYRLLGDWCREQGVLHLAVAHHRDDQAETLLMRLGRGSGLSGLAAMAPLIETAQWRLLRPLLDLPAVRLRATLAAAGSCWIEDPTNRNPAHLRARIRHAGSAWARLGLDPARLAATAGHLARARRVIEGAIDRLLAEVALVHPAGFVTLDRSRWAEAERELRLRALAAALVTVGGAEHAPRFERLSRLEAVLAGPERFAGATLGGCRLESRHGRILVLREPAAIGARVPLPPAGTAILWDGRFRVVASATAPPPGLTVGALGSAGVRAIRAIVSPDAGYHLPSTARLALPAIWREDRLIGVPQLGWWLAGEACRAEIRFRPPRLLSQSGF